MLSFFPKPYPDEIFYSILARYHIRSGNISPKVTLQEIFNSTTVIATADLPCHLETVVAKLSPISAITVEELIQQHTLYPFYAPFLPQERSQQIFQAMKASDGGNIHDKTGIRASSIHAPKYFRFCPRCIEHDQERYGELYWHRSHQVPGVLVCPHHAEVLHNSTVPIQGMNRHEYYAASLDNCVRPESIRPFNDTTLKTCWQIAQDVYFLLTTELPARKLNWFYKQYMASLIEKGLATATGRVHQRELLDQFLYFYGHPTLKVLDSAIDRKDDANWLSNLVRKHRKAFHPIRHLLLLRFLEVPVEAFLKDDRTYTPFGAGPWLCLNAAAEHYLQPIITQLEISLCGDTKKPVGTFSCSCEFVYCRTGPDETEDDLRRIGKVKAVGSVWQDRLKQLVEVERSGLRETARRLKVDPQTIKRYVRLLGLTPGWQSSNREDDLEPKETSALPEVHLEDIKTHHRESWKTQQRQHRDASKTALRKLVPATYSWLYRNDRTWLEQNSPLIHKPVVPNKRVDWQQRDEQILAEVKRAVQTLLAAEKPVQITVSRVAKAIAHLALVEQHIDKMPLTRAYLDSVVETVEDFQIRRIKWAVDQLDRQGEAIEPWKVVRMAGLKATYSERVREAIESEVYGRGVTIAVTGAK